MRAGDPAAAARAFVAAGRPPNDPANVRSGPARQDLRRHRRGGHRCRRRAPGADAIGLNFVPGTPRALSSSTRRSALARAGPGDRRRLARGPPIVPITADLPAAEALTAIGRGRSIPMPSSCSGRRAADGHRRHRPARLEGPASALGSRRRRIGAGVRHGRGGRAARAYLAAGAARILLDTAGGPHPGGTGVRVDADLAAAVAREVPVILAGGLDPANVGRGASRASRRSAST